LKIKNIYKEEGLLGLGFFLMGLGISKNLNTVAGAVLFAIGAAFVLLKEIVVMTK